MASSADAQHRVVKTTLPTTLWCTAVPSGSTQLRDHVVILEILTLLVIDVQDEVVDGCVSINLMATWDVRHDGAQSADCDVCSTSALHMNTSHHRHIHTEETDAGLDRPLHVRNKLYNKTLKSQNYYSNILRFLVPWRSALWLYNTSWLDQNLSKRFLKQLTVSAETTWFERLLHMGITRLVKLNFLKS